MSRITTTKKINETLTNNLLHIGKVEVYYKTSGKTETIDTDAFQESLGFLCETIFADCIGVRRHIVGGANRTLISAITSLRSCGIGTCRRLSSG